ncbi:LysE family translocator [Thaumasiovibrio subtropicus]|uniref:LysE family translocator n=1 Tax=Thaumasiovibrio subtropicus TaxID=1891207 RepID=UPI000B35744E|nr:LysE family transporter [Thaumasiovibrio subtropicus]
MLEIFFYAIIIMYSPGPVNMIGLNTGIQGLFRQYMPFCGGVALAMYLLFNGVSLISHHFVPDDFLPYISVIGSSYIVYLSLKVWRSANNVAANNSPQALSFRDGFFMQLLNPKAFVVILPIVTIQFPAAGITGLKAFLICTLMGLLAFGAPASYAFLGNFIGDKLQSPTLLAGISRTLAGLLFLVGLSIGYEHAFLHWYAGTSA